MTYLFMVFTFTCVLISVLIWLEASHEIEELFDAQLSQDSKFILGIAVQAFNKGIVLDSREIISSVQPNHEYEKKISFQIWYRDRLLVKSDFAPDTRMSLHEGYSDQIINGIKWRTFKTSLTFKNKTYHIIVAESYAIRNELLTEIVINLLIPFVLVLPVFLILLHYVIIQGLTPLYKLARTVENKQVNDFSPIADEAVPQEILSVIHSLNNLLEKQESAFSRERRFTNNAAHELRSPIAAIQVQAQVAINSFDKPQQLKNALDNILKGTERSTRLVQQMLTLARLEPEAIQNKFGTFNLDDLIQNTLADMAHLALQKEMELSFEHAESRDYHCYGYADGIQIMLRNIIENAIRYTPQGGSIKISLKVQDNDFVIVVKDSGPGIHADDLDKVMERYYRATDQNDQGCGLGMSIVKHIVELHQGSIILENDNGLRVTICLPANKPV